MKSNNFLILFVIIIINTFSLNHSNSIEADVFVQSTVNRASQALSNKYSKDEKIEKLKFLNVDFTGFGGPARTRTWDQYIMSVLL